MLVVMRRGSTGAERDAVCDRAREAGMTAVIYTDADMSVVSLDGPPVAALRDALAALPGVGAVVRRDSEAIQTSNLRIAGIRPLVPPAILLEELPLPVAGANTVSPARDAVSRILRGEDDRLIVIVGPCSIHDVRAGREYAERLAALAATLAHDLLIVMRVYFEKPRTTVGWKGLINDPHLDGSFAINEGLHLARQFLLDVVALGLPTGCEFLDPILPQFFTDAVTWGAIGARTTESQVHRDLASGLSMPVGFKNGTDGDVQIAIDALRAAAFPHHFPGVTGEGLAAILATRGNGDCHVILRGGTSGPNYDADTVAQTLTRLRAVHLPPRLMIDLSHGNSEKDYRRQVVAAQSVAPQIAAGETGIIGVMAESFLADGRQDLNDPARLVYGQSITDGCMGWDMTVPVLQELAGAVRTRRARREQ